MAGHARFELATDRLTADCSAIELMSQVGWLLSIETKHPSKEIILYCTSFRYLILTQDAVLPLWSKWGESNSHGYLGKVMFYH